MMERISVIECFHSAMKDGGGGCQCRRLASDREARS